MDGDDEPPDHVADANHGKIVSEKEKRKKIKTRMTFLNKEKE